MPGVCGVHAGSILTDSMLARLASVSTKTSRLTASSQISHCLDRHMRAHLHLRRKFPISTLHTDVPFLSRRKRDVHVHGVLWSCRASDEPRSGGVQVAAHPGSDSYVPWQSMSITPPALEGYDAASDPGPRQPACCPTRLQHQPNIRTPELSACPSGLFSGIPQKDFGCASTSAFSISLHSLCQTRHLKMIYRCCQSL